MEISIRPATEADAAACGGICYEGFRALNERHGFPSPFPSAEAAAQRMHACIEHAAIHGLIATAEGDGARLLGFCFLSEHDPIRAVGPIVVAPEAQGGGVGRRLMQAALARASGARGVRLTQESYNMGSLALYASLGFEAKEPLVLMTGVPRQVEQLSGWEVRPLRGDDLPACAALHERVHGVSRAAELHGALATGSPIVALRAGRVVAYAAAPAAWLANHGVAETEDDMRALLLGGGCTTGGPLSLLLPIRQAGLFRWCLDQGLRPVKPMTLMARGEYREPKGSWFPSVLY